MKYLTKLIVPNVPHANTFPYDLEADSPAQAAHKALDHWINAWEGPLPDTGPVIYVYGHPSVSSGGGDQVLFNMIWKTPTFNPDAMEAKRAAWAQVHKPARAE